MNKPASTDFILDQVHSSIAQALGISRSQISPDSKLFSDLAMESIDVLDVTFRLEKELGIKLDEKQIFGSGDIPRSSLTVQDVAKRLQSHFDQLPK